MMKQEQYKLQGKMARLMTKYRGIKNELWNEKNTVEFLVQCAV